MHPLKKTLLSLARKNPLFGAAKRAYQAVRDWYYRVLPIDDKLIVFEAFRSTKYVDSPRAIYEYLLGDEKYAEYRFIWLFEHPEDYTFLEENNRTKVVKHETHAYYAAFARAKYWVVNGWIPLRVQKKPGQVALQCWHGTPLKRLRYDIVTSEETLHQRKVHEENNRDMARYDYLISPSAFATKAFISAFGLKRLGKEQIVVETGYPRNDALVGVKPSLQAKYREKHRIPVDKKVLLYAPTWRDDQHVTEGGYKYKTPVDFDYLKKELADDWVILFRAHNLVANQFDFSRYDGFVCDVSRVDEINELYIMADVLMTDYSSVFFDYANLHRPIVFFMYDREHYEKDLRGFYIDLETLPGDIIETEQGVVTALRDLSDYSKRNQEKYTTFSKQYNYLDDGKATERVVETFLAR